MWGLEDVRIGLAGALIGTAILVAGSAMGAPCDGIDRTLSAADRAALAAPIAAQLHVPSVDVLQSFRDGAWRIVYVDSHVADEAFLFFSADPTRQHYLALWGGAATPAEAPGIETWAAAHAPGVPKALAACFAWRATGGD
jgi:hypothetical protein